MLFQYLFRFFIILILISDQNFVNLNLFKLVKKMIIL